MFYSIFSLSIKHFARENAVLFLLIINFWKEMQIHILLFTTKSRDVIV